MSRTLRIDICVCCENGGPVVGRGLTRACYQRHWKAGTLDRFPAVDPAVRLESRREGARKSQQKHIERFEARVEDYAELRGWRETREQAAARLGVTERAAQRYERRLREQVSA